MQTIEPCQISNGFVKYKDGARYEGEIFNAVPHGKGTLRTIEGHGYSGTFSYGKLEGYGTWTAPDGKTSHGVWEKSGEFNIIEVREVTKNNRKYIDERLSVVDNNVQEIAKKADEIFWACNNIDLMLDDIRIDDALWDINNSDQNGNI